jgi:hypothetical protein
MKLVEAKEFVTSLIANDHHFTKLLKIVKVTGEILEENCVYDKNGSKKIASFISKQRNLYSVAKYGGDNIIEIGFNAGHSALIFLIANPKSIIKCFDTCTNKYTKLCFDYLHSVFGYRISLIKGNSKEVYSKFCSNKNKLYDTFHIDGSKDYNISNIDYFNSRSIANVGSVIIWDTSQPHLKSLWEGYKNDKDLMELKLADVTYNPHSIAYFVKIK